MSVWAQSWKGSSEVDLESGNSDALEMNKANDSIAGIKVRREVEYQNCRELKKEKKRPLSFRGGQKDLDIGKYKKHNGLFFNRKKGCIAHEAGSKEWT